MYTILEMVERLKECPSCREFFVCKHEGCKCPFCGRIASVEPVEPAPISPPQFQLGGRFSVQGRLRYNQFPGINAGRIH